MYMSGSVDGLIVKTMARDKNCQSFLLKFHGLCTVR